MVSLLSLPPDLLHEILAALPPSGICCLEKTSLQLLRISRADNVLWRKVAEKRWGPLCDANGEAPNWRDELVWLETEVAPTLRKNVRSALKLMEARGLLGGKRGSWVPCVHSLLSWETLVVRRRLAAFVCADWQPRDTLRGFLQPFDLRAPTPEAALRNLLYIFPFLPIDAGSGADRVIGEFARQYVIANPEAILDLRIGSGSGGAVVAAPTGEESSSDEEEDGVVKRFDKYAGCDRLARDGVYALIYSLVMLNTDLHNVAIQPKIQAEQYIASCHRCVPLRDVPDEYLRRLYASILSSPLRISHDLLGCGGSIVRSGGADADETVSGATYSVYSALRPDLAAATGATAAAATTGAAAGVGAGGVTDAELAAATAAAAAAASGRAAPLPKVDWTVAYWNIVDGCRWCRARAAAKAAASAPHVAHAAVHVALVSVCAWLLRAALVPWLTGTLAVTDGDGMQPAAA